MTTAASTATGKARFGLLPAMAAAAMVIVAFSPVRSAAADGCDITSDSCDCLASIDKLRTDVAAEVPGPLQRSFTARLDRIERGVTILETGESTNDLFAVLVSYLKTVNAETRQDRENARQEWRADFLATLAADVDAVLAEICHIVACGTEE